MYSTCVSSSSDSPRGYPGHGLYRSLQPAGERRGEEGRGRERKGGEGRGREERERRGKSR